MTFVPIKVLDALHRAAKSLGSQTAFAKSLGLSLAYVNDVLNGRRNPNDAMLAAAGYERVTIYRKKEPARE